MPAIHLSSTPDFANCRRIDSMCLPGIASMMHHGVCIDVDYLSDLDTRFRNRCTELEQSILDKIPDNAKRLWMSAAEDSERAELESNSTNDAATIDFNPRSPEDVCKLLYEVLQLGKTKAIKTTKSGTRLSTGKKMLELIKSEHTIVADLLEYKKLNKLVTTYTTALPKKAVVHLKNHCWCGARHTENHYRIHGQFLPTRTSTGRLASKDPNLQNIPVRSVEGALIRKAFIPAPGKVWVGGDYSQVELRILAHMSADPVMIDIYQRNGDIHIETAMRAFGLANASLVDKFLHRLPAKTVNFGIVYGLTPEGLLANLILLYAEAGITIPDYLTLEWCADFIATYFNLYKQIKNYLDLQTKLMYKYGYVWTCLGRVREIPHKWSKFRRIRSEGERQACNAPIQGTGGDFGKIAIGNCTENMPAKRDLGIQLLLTVHDELTLECWQGAEQDVAKWLRTNMELLPKMRVPITADVGTSTYWSK